VSEPLAPKAKMPQPALKSRFVVLASGCTITPPVYNSPVTPPISNYLEVRLNLSSNIFGSLY
jgi:hypothetical protein